MTYEERVELDRNQLRFILVGPEGATEFAILHGWHAVRFNQFNQAQGLPPDLAEIFPHPAHVATHSKQPFFGGQSEHMGCEYFDGPCYWDPSASAAEPLFQAVVSGGGHQLIWEYLRAIYYEQFLEEDDDGPLHP